MLRKSKLRKHSLKHLLKRFLLQSAGALTLLAPALTASAQSTLRPFPIPTLHRRGAQTHLIVNGQPYLILGAEANNSSGSSLEFMRSSFAKLNAMHANTAVVSLSWELTEPEEGHFDFRLVDGLIKEARHHRLHLVFLWFGTWKNTFSTYTPAWVETDRTRFLSAQPEPGKDWGAVSAWSVAGRDADARAFAAVMRRIKQVDGTQHTVLMMQVENETGLIGGTRDHVPAAETDYAGPVPPALMTYLQANHAALIPELREAWEAAGARSSGTWSEVFGAVADEVFMAWHYGRYVDAVAAAGKKEYPIPMFVNAWLEGSPGSYPMGGPVSRMMDVWRAAGPHLDLFAPDIYGNVKDFHEVSARYTRSRNPLLVVESAPDATAANAFTAIAGFGAIGFGPYPVEAPLDTTGIGEVYQCLGNMMPLLTQAQGTGRLAGVLVDKDQHQEFEMGGYHVKVTGIETHPAGTQAGYGLVLEMGPGDFIVVGHGISVGFSTLPGSPNHVARGSVDEGRFDLGGVWVPGRRLNGDEQEKAMSLDGTEPGRRELPQRLQIRRVTVFTNR